MYLKAVEIFGFKSFGERVYIEFNRGITSIVGPNGSGKSNILDAVLWVLGEQSYKNIRAKESSDVIFSGGKDKKPMNSAEVSLYIDNTDSFLPLENEEIKVTRKLYATGDNEYYINDVKTRLKDIGNLFLDTGVGKSAYSVIGQGKVERIIGSSSKEIKGIIEEAAGIKKFQIKKNEAVKNLSNVELELEKIDLVLREVKENRDRVEKQAGKAQEYLNLKDERDKLAKGIYLSEFNEKQAQIDDGDAVKEKLTSEAAELEREFNSIENRLDEIDREKLVLKKEIEELSGKNQELKREIELKEREKVRISERVEGYKREVSDRHERMKSSDLKISEKLKSLDMLVEERETLKEKIEKLSEENLKFESQLKELENTKKEFDLGMELKKKKVMELELEKLKLLNEIESSSRRVKGSNTKIANLREELSSYDIKLNSAVTELGKAEISKIEKEKKLIEIEERGTFLEEEISKLSQRSNKLSEIVRTAEYDEKRHSAKLQALVRMEENNEGFFKGVKEVLNSKIIGIEGVFISLVTIPEKLEKAIEAGIPGNIQDIVVDTGDTAKKAINFLKERKAGRASFLALDTIKVPAKRDIKINIPGVIGRAAELVTADERYRSVVEFVLGNLLIVENLDTALKIVKNNMFMGNVVTLSGELMSSRGRITGGDSGNSTASQIFERKKEIRTLKETVEKLTSTIKNASAEQNEISINLENFENEIDKIDSLEDGVRKQLKLAEELYNDYILKKERIEKDRRVVKVELEEEEKYSQEFEKRINSSKDERERVDQVIAEIKADEEHETERIREINSNIEKKKEEFSDVRILFMNSQDRLGQLDREEEREKKEYEFLVDEKRNMEEKTAFLENEIISLEEKEKILKSEIEERINKYESENTEVQERKVKNEALTEEERALNKKRKETESYLLHKRDSLNRVEESLERTKIDLEKLKDILSTLEEVEAIEVEEEKLKELKDRLKILDNRLKNFQAVNLLAIEEFKELNNKYIFLTTQKDDLVKGKDVLMELIKEIDDTIHEKFFTAYKEIDANFNQMCMETLNNSEGKLLVINPENFDECGVEIFVKFKNKKRQTLSLLSGGEKSMVAIAFIMSIFMYKPSPFTFLDEIEAALDEKNTRKLIGKLKEFTEKSQFILITHNKDTMRESESIFGVTMNKEIGISKIVPVKF